MKFILLFLALVAIVASVSVSPDEPDVAADSNGLNLVRHKRLSCLFEGEDMRAMACGMSCIIRKGKRGGRCVNGICVYITTYPFKTLGQWFEEVNMEYSVMNRYSAHFQWLLSTKPTAQISEDAALFGAERSRWISRKCKEGERLLPELNDIHKRQIYLLCRGPRYTNYQGGQLSELLTRMQNIYTDTKICLPKNFDFCLNYQRMFDYTYVRRPSGETVPMNLSIVVKDRQHDDNPLNYFDRQLSHNYYVFRGVKGGIIEDEAKIDRRIRRGKFFCLGIEPELEKIMTGDFAALERPDCMIPADLIFRWAWEAWRLAVGPEIGKHYPSAVYFMNSGANNNGYNDIGEAWREELEMNNLRGLIDNLWRELKPYYELLHAVVRSALWVRFGHNDEAIKNGPLPAHLLGNMWAQDWSKYHTFLLPKSNLLLDDLLKNTSWTARDMAKRADDFYSSMGLNPMTAKFWKYSQFEKTSNKTKCHGTAANMFRGDDYRMIVCGELTFDGFYTIVHEMGHIQYYMHFNAAQPSLLQDATNSAISESIGDAIFLAMMAPSHLHRLGILQDSHLFSDSPPEFDRDEMAAVHNFGMKFKQDSSENSKSDSLEKDELPRKSRVDQSQLMNANDLTLLFKVGLAKIPQLPFQYIFDVFRWGLFEGSIPFNNANDAYWKLSIDEQGIRPPNWEERSKLFDAAAKFHFADNTPYVRYFLASILQAQIFRGLCEVTVFGKVNSGKRLPLPLHKCDIYGSKRAGKILKRALKAGSSEHWSKVLLTLTGREDISIEPFLEYYRPLFQALRKVIKDFDIPVGWEPSAAVLMQGKPPFTAV